MDNVPVKPACSPLEPYGSAGATTTSGRAAANRSARATAMTVSVDSGRCGPCCSVDPSGTTSTVVAAASVRSVQQASASAVSRRGIG